MANLTILVFWGYYNKTAQSGWLKHLFLAVVEVWKSKVKAVLSQGEIASFLNSNCFFTLASHSRDRVLIKARIL